MQKLGNQIYAVLSMGFINGFYQWVLSMSTKYAMFCHPSTNYAKIRQSNLCVLSMGFINGFYQWVLSMGFINGFYQWVLSMGFINGFYQ